MTNTQLRITSALILLLIVGLVAFLGFFEVVLFVSVAGVLCIDEIYINLIKLKRNINYYFVQFLFLLTFLVTNLYFKSFETNIVLTYVGLTVNSLLLVYLFGLKMESNLLIDLFKKIPVLIIFLILPQVSSLASLLYYGNWLKIISVFLAICIGMDTGAWFFGKNFGKHKLWPLVSPNKTIEGLFGGALSAGLLSSGFWFAFSGHFSFANFIIFSIIGLVSQTGDLVQSKFKRQAKVKDSSSLIPGHGGVYDRIDSIIFAIPVFAIFVYYFYN